MQPPPLGGWAGGRGGDLGPHGGYGEPRPWYLRKRVIIGVAIIVVVALLSLSTRDDPGRGERGRDRPAPTKATTRSAAPPATAVQGRGARDANLAITVNRVRCGVRRIGKGLRTRVADGQFCLLLLTVVNVGERRLGLGSVEMRLLGSDGRRYEPELQARGAVVGGQAVWNELAPGERSAGTVVFELPAGARPVRLELDGTQLPGPTSMDLPG